MREVITLSNRKRVANFSSPHPFTFTDGSILPAIPDVDSERLKIAFKEVKVNKHGDVLLKFSLTSEVYKEMAYWMEEWRKKRVDVVFCALPMLVAFVEKFSDMSLELSPFRGVRMEDRIKKLASIDKQCLASSSYGAQM
jgi:hypothetical protein